MVIEKDILKYHLMMVYYYIKEIIKIVNDKVIGSFIIGMVQLDINNIL
jgi:hypothetical protein